jgi:hypothetical protein
MPGSPQKKTSLNPIGVIGMTLFGGFTMILTMLAILFFPLAGAIGALWDVLAGINPFKKREKTHKASTSAGLSADSTHSVTNEDRYGKDATEET